MQTFVFIYEITFLDISRQVGVEQIMLLSRTTLFPKISILLLVLF